VKALGLAPYLVIKCGGASVQQFADGRNIQHIPVEMDVGVSDAAAS
jgi:hypothetical protein